jgi:hypothetical protein
VEPHLLFGVIANRARDLAGVIALILGVLLQHLERQIIFSLRF